MAGRAGPLRLLLLLLLLLLCLAGARAVGAQGAADRQELIAVCVIGRLRALKITLEPFKTKMLAALTPSWERDVDLLFYTPKPRAEELRSLASLFEAPSAVRAVRFDDERDVLESLSLNHMPELMQALQIPGNWLGSARQVLLPQNQRPSRRSGTGVFQMYAHGQCLEMIEERERRSGRRYDRIVLTRTDLKWIFPHPPLALLPADRVWVPDNRVDDWGGIYDRHLVFPRDLADWVLGGWRLLVTGKAAELIYSTGRPHLWEGQNGTNTETWLLIRLMFGAGAEVSRFPMTAYIACDEAEWRGKKAHGSVHGFSCRKGHDYRYPMEYESVRWFAGCLEKDSAVAAGGSWSLAQAKKCYCPWWDMEFLMAARENYALCHLGEPMDQSLWDSGRAEIESNRPEH